MMSVMGVEFKQGKVLSPVVKADVNNENDFGNSPVKEVLT